MYACHNGHAAAVEMLLKLGADRDVTDINGYTALMLAIFSDRQAVASILLTRGAPVSLCPTSSRSRFC